MFSADEARTKRKKFPGKIAKKKIEHKPTKKIFSQVNLRGVIEIFYWNHVTEWCWNLGYRVPFLLPDVQSCHAHCRPWRIYLSPYKDSQHPILQICKTVPRLQVGQRFPLLQGKTFYSMQGSSSLFQICQKNVKWDIDPLTKHFEVSLLISFFGCGSNSINTTVSLIVKDFCPRFILPQILFGNRTC